MQIIRPVIVHPLTPISHDLISLYLVDEFRCNLPHIFINRKFPVGLLLTFGLNDRCIPIQYDRWSAKGFGEAIKLLIARWVKLLDTGMWLFCFDTLCQLTYMIYVTNAHARINILSITACCKEYRLFVADNS